MEKQCRYSLNFSVAGVVGQLIGHVVPVVDGVAEISGKRVACIVVRVRAPSGFGISPIMHDLTHGHGYATRFGMATRDF